MGDFLGPGPNIETIRYIDGSICERITYPDGRVEMRNIPQPPFYASTGDAFVVDPRTWSNTVTDTGREWRGLSMTDYSDIRRYMESEEESKVEVIRKESPVSGEHIVACCNEKDLAPENILKTLSAVKGKLMIDIAPIRIRKIECCMTPQVRKNIVTASKRLKMYGKKRPIIARFDEYGNRLPDEIDIGTSRGITLKIIEPEKYGPYYLELKGLEFSDKDFIYSVDPEDLPF